MNLKTSNEKTKIVAPITSTIVDVNVKNSSIVLKGQIIVTVESMKMQSSVAAPVSGSISDLNVSEGQTVEEGQLICYVTEKSNQKNKEPASKIQINYENQIMSDFESEIEKTLDKEREQEVIKRHSKGYRTARENLEDLVDAGSFVEYGQLAVAAQRDRLNADELKLKSAADGVLTGLATINSSQHGGKASQVAVIINDYTAMAGTQGFFHHKKIDRLIDIAKKLELPVVMYTEGGGGRPGDIDVKTQIAGLDVSTFSSWAGLKGKNPLIVVNNGYCFAGNAALFGCGDIRIATQSSCIGMAGPAMIEGGGLGLCKPNDIGPSNIHFENGVIDLLAEDEMQATELAKKCLSFTQGDVTDFEFSDQSVLRDIMPLNRQETYDIRKVAHTLVDAGSFLELTSGFGKTIMTAFARIDGRAVGLIASDCMSLGGAIDTKGAVKASRFFHICNVFKLPVVSLVDTPGFMVGPESEKQGAVNHMTSLFVAGAKLEMPLICIFLRKGYGLGAMAMAGGSFKIPIYTASWPTGEFGAMGIEGAVKLGFKKELESVEAGLSRDNLFADLVDKMYDRGRATEAASFLEIDAVIDPSESRFMIARSLNNELM